jgi:hypothetical protein
MQARSIAPREQASEDPQSEHTHIQPVGQPRRVPVEALEYHLFRPSRTYDPLLEDAYEVWRDGWKATLLELDGNAALHSDEFGRQDELAVVAIGGRCIAVTGLRWLDMALPRSREDSYFKSWPSEAVVGVGDHFVLIASNTVVHPAWRRTLIEAPKVQLGDPMRLVFATIALTVRRFVASSAQKLIALTRNDRAIDRVGAALGAQRLAQTRVHGIETDVVCLTRSNAPPAEPIVRELWSRRHQS